MDGNEEGRYIIQPTSPLSTPLYSFLISYTYRLKVYNIETMNTNDRQDQKHRRAKRRNFVAKNNKHKAKRHTTLKDYRRKPKHALEDESLSSHS